MPIARTLSLVAVLAATLPAAQAQVSNWQSVATACVATTPTAAQQVQVVNNGSYLRAPLAGRNPPTLNFVCNVLDPYNVVTPAWTTLQLQYLDSMGGAVTATLYAKSKANGAISAVATVTPPASAVVTTAAVPLPGAGLDFGVNSYYVLLTFRPQASTQPQLHSVTLAE